MKISKTAIFALSSALMLPTVAHSQSKWAPALADGLQNMADQMAAMAYQQQIYQNQKELLQQQYDLEMAKIREQYRLEAEARNAENQRQIAIQNSNITKVEQSYPNWIQTMRDPSFAAWASLQKQFQNVNLDGMFSASRTNPDVVIAVMTSYKQYQDMAAGYRRLEDAHPSWVKMVQTKAFSNWMNKQPKSVQNLANSDRFDDAMLMLDLYEASLPKHKSKVPPTKNINATQS